MVWTCHLLCKSPRCYHSASKTRVAERIFKLSPIYASVIYQIPWICWISDPFKETPLLNFNGDFDGGSDVTCKGPIYTKRQHQRCDDACNSVLIENNGVTPEWQGSHSDWKTWKNGKAFSSQGKVREFWTDWKSQGKSHKILENSGNLR